MSKSDYKKALKLHRVDAVYAGTKKGEDGELHKVYDLYMRK